MRTKVISLVFLMVGSLTLAARPVQTVGSDLKDAGQKTTGAVKTGATKSTKAVKKGTHRAAAATAKGANSVKNKTTGTSN